MQAKICLEMKVKKEIDPQREIETRVEFLKEQLRASGLTSLVLGISGGQDSTLTGKLCQIAVEQLRTETDTDYKFIAVRLPYGIQSDEADCSLALKFIEPDQLITYNIKDVVDTHSMLLAKCDQPISDFNKGNIKARERMIVQYAIAGNNRGLVVGTDHSSEAITGFYTKHGDGAADLAPIFGLNKRQGKQILAYLDCPQQLYLKQPTADLEELKPGLEDEVALGVSYEHIDDYLEQKQIPDEARAVIERHYMTSSHKRESVKTIYSI